MRLKTFTERGQALVLIALAAVGLFAVVGLAIDGSAKFSDQRQAQNAADTAALAAALAKVTSIAVDPNNNNPAECPTADPATNPYSTACVALLDAARDRAESNGYNGNPATNVVEVYSPPQSGYYAGNEDYVQVIITSYVNTFFARVIGIDQTKNVVQAVALAKPGYNLADGAMLISYDPDPTCNLGGASGGGSVDVSGTSHVNLNGGGIFINSQEACGFAGNCPDLTITGGSINSAATVDNIDQDGCAVQSPENINQDPVEIPDDVYWPPVPPECGINPPPPPTKLGDVMAGSPAKLTGEWLIYPGFYVNFPPSDLVGNKQLIYMASGVYCIDPPQDQDLSWSPVDFVTLNGSIDPVKNKYADPYNKDGVTLYIKKGGGFTLNANNPTLLDATTKTTSEYQGYLIILEGDQSSIETCSITGGSDLDINGMIFAPYCRITVNGGSETTAVINAQLLGWDLNITGTNTINFNYDPDNQVKVKRRIGLMK